MKQTGTIGRSRFTLFLMLSRNVLVILCCLMPSVSGAPPYFIAPQGNAEVVTIAENTPPGTPIYVVKFADQDPGDTLSTTTTGTSDFTLSATRTHRESILTPNRLFKYSNPTDRKHKITITVSDGTLSASVKLTVKVTQANNHVGTISGNFTTVLKEELPVGAVVKFKNLNLTKASAGNVQVYSLSGKDASYFYIGRLSGVISVARRIDRDRDISKTTDLLLTVSNQTGYTATASLTVVIEDINDNAPVCTPSVYYANVAENGTSGALVGTVRCQDVDDGPNKALHMQLDSTNGNDKHFSIDQSGNITTTNDALDYEGLAGSNFRLELIVLVNDMPTSNLKMTGTATVMITVLPVNEFSPKWVQFIPPLGGSPMIGYNVMENLPVGTLIATAKAIDNDLGPDGEITYVVNITGPEATFFRMDAVTGEITVRSPADADPETGGNDFYHLEVVAKDGGGKSSKDITIWLMIDNVNDNDPYFTSSVYRASIAENATVGTDVIFLNAIDKDVLSSLSCSIVGGDSKGKFRFSSTNASLLQLNAAINPDKPKHDPVFYNLKVQVKDGGVPERTGEADVLIQVQTINDHAPVFSPSSRAQVKEDASVGTPVVRITATDNDWGDDKNIVYQISAGNTGGAFTISKTEGIIQVAQSLDFEKLSVYKLTITASDEGTPKMSSSAVQEISITNINDLPVVCSRSYLHIQIPENVSVNTEVATLNCTDKDNLTALTHKISGAGSGIIQIDSNGHLRLIAALDYDKGPRSYSFDISVSDGIHVTTVPVTVTVIPVNEFAPYFLVKNITKNLGEDAPINSLVANVRVKDKDASPHDVTRMWIQNALSPAMFQLEGTGNIRLNRKLDYETQTSYSLVVVAVDGGNLKATCTVSVLVGDVNDNAPVCTNSMVYVALNENEAIGTPVSSLNCRDADSGTFGKLRYSLKQTPFGGNFIVKNTTGEVILHGNGLDFETTKSYQLKVLVEDGGFKQTTVFLMIDVIDVNDGPPSFPNASTTVSIPENNPVMSIVTKMAANDPDDKMSPYGKLIYDIISGNNKQIFAIDGNSGQITLAGNLDREKIPMYVLTISATESATNNAASATASLTVSVLDVNDNPPMCTFLSFHREVKESTLPGSRHQIITLPCTDLDTPATGGTLTYSMTVGDQSVFALINNTLILKGQLDFDQGIRQYPLTLTVSDSLFTLDIHGSVAVTPVDEFSPVFTPGHHYSAQIPEDRLIGQLILMVNAIDQDSSDTSDGVVTYSLQSSSSLPFTVDGSTGQISLISSLDWEMKQFYSFKVTASDKSHHTSTTVNITVVDVNDNHPVFVRGSYSQKIGETVPIGTTVIQVTATDADGPSNGNITYTIIGGNSGGEFDIVPDTGQIRTLKALDYDAMGISSFTLRVKAADRNGGHGSLSGTALVTVLLLSVNEYAPSFTQNTYLVSVKESEPIGFQFLQVSSSDMDRGPDGDVYYSITNNPLFALDSATGKFYLRRPLDFETSSRHEFNVTATDMGSSPKSHRATVVVNVVNVNDEKPVCTTSFLAIDIREDFSLRKTILKVNCVDKDNGTYGQLNYLIRKVNGLVGSGPFKIDNTGELSLASPLDYDKVKVLTLEIVVSDGGSPSKSTEVTVKLTVLDVNEATPVFNTFPRSITIPESTPIGNSIAKVSARDNDTSDTLTYYFTTPSNYFQINPITADIKVKALLDFERQRSFTLHVRVTDSGTPQSNTAQTTLTVTLSDVNDSPPVFSSSVYQRNVQENRPGGTTVATLTVSDADSGSNAQATFRIVKGDTTNSFRVARDGAGNCDVSLATSPLLDYEHTTQYTLLIRAEDIGGLSAEATLSIQVQPYNEYAPSFQSISSNLPIKEDVRIGTPVAKITATDRDAGQDGTIFYDLSGGLGKFIIDRHSGVIIIRDQLDKEQVDSYQLLVVAKDGGVLPSALTSTLTLTVTVEDVNDNDPTCAGQQQNIVFVPENQPVGTHVFQLLCTDGDQDPANKNNVLRYSIFKGNTVTFAIDPHTGLLTTVAPLDREVIASYELTVRVSDLGSPSRSVDQIVYVQITDVNDNAPVFTTNNYTVSVSESSPTANVVLKVSATDRDAGNAGVVCYSIRSGNVKRQFALDSLTGDLKLTNNLDRETISHYSLLIQAMDRGSPAHSATTRVTVTVIDENDNSPSCSSTYYSTTLKENARPSTPVISLHCTDLDVGANSVLTYSITSGNTNSPFNIGSATGNIKVHSNLDAELTSKYILHIDVSDKAHTTKVEVEIVLLDVNESPPKFTPPGPFGIRVLENAAIGSSVFQVVAKDDDVSSTTIFFSFPAPNKYFNINKMTGVVSINNRLDREAISKHALTIKVTDNGSPGPLSSSTLLTITVGDVNDNSPSCTKTHYVVSLPEDTPKSTWVANISCSDVDTSSPVVKYTIEAGNSSGIFEVIPSTGQISLKKSLDYETADLHTLVVRADDNGASVTLSTRVKLIVKVLPINEHAPTFGTTSNNIISVMENSTLGTLIKLVSATDADKGEDNGDISFAIKSGDPSGHFLIDSTTGKISLVKNLDRESKDQYTLTVTAKDCIRGFGTPRTASTTIRINVTDANDNYPEFGQTSYTVSVSENATNGSKLLTLGAHDDDLGSNGQVAFIIKSGDPTNIFALNNKDLVVKGKLDFLTTSFYLLKIRAQDRGVPPLSSYAYVSVHVQPENNYPPTFSKGNASIVLKENHTIGSIVYRANATDRDTGNSYGLNISINSVIPSNAPIHAFVIDHQRGAIRLAAQLDYDTLPNKFALVISVTDKGSSPQKPLSSTMTLSITIENINDNPPVFTQNTYSFSVNENTSPNTPVGKVTAVDKDLGQFGLVSYNVARGDGPDFGLIQKDGTFFVNGSLDFERKKSYVYFVEAVDQGNPVKSGGCFVRISVQDLNDSPPKFHLTSYSSEVPEDAPVGRSVIKIDATDADSAVNGNSHIQFRMTETTAAKSFFRIDAASGLITVHRSLDRENMDKHTLVVYATDSGTPRLTSSTSITVNVADVNDNSPVFIGQYKATISEETHIGSMVFRLAALDRDIGRNGAVTFDIQTGNTDGDFRLDSTSGYLLTHKLLDRERTPQYSIQIKAADGGSPQRFATTIVSIAIKDENDNKPLFGSTSYALTVAENLPAPARVGQLSAFDRDLGRNALLTYRILYMLTGPNDFNIDGGTGVITSRSKLDRESVSYYKLWCEVTDGGNPSLTGNAEVEITVSDENDHVPTFQQNSFTASVSEQDPVGTTVISFNILDGDAANFGLITLSILPKVGNATLAGHYFNVLSTNQSLVLKRMVDREKVSEFHFTILAQDGGIPRLSSKATLDILVGDYNDHDPVFTKTFHDLEIAYDGSCTSFLTRVSAVDPDKGDNGRIGYYFVRSRYNYLFVIDDIKGDVRIQMGSEKNWIYILTVNAHDYGSPQRRSSNNATLRIDTFDPTEIATSIQLGINRKDFEKEQAPFMKQLNSLLRAKYPGGRFEVWCIQERDGAARSSPQAMRRLAASDKPVTVNVYCVKSNTSNDPGNIKKKKDFCGQKEALSFLTVEANGEISGALKGPAWDYYAIQKVNGYGNTKEVSWSSTTNGMIIIALTCLLILFMSGIFLGYCYWRRKKYSSIVPNRPTIEERIASKDDDELKKKLFRPNALASPNLHSNNAPNNKHHHTVNKLKDTSFDGRAIDPVSGLLYEYNTLTNESRWVSTPVNTPKITPKSNLL